MSHRSTKAGDIANIIRKQVGIVITEENDRKTVFSKEELLLVVAGIAHKRVQADEKMVETVVKELLAQQENK